MKFEDITLIFVILFIIYLVGYCTYYQTIDSMNKPKLWYVDRGWRIDWEFSTKELARERAGSGRIYQR